MILTLILAAQETPIYATLECFTKTKSMLRTLSYLILLIFLSLAQTRGVLGLPTDLKEESNLLSRTLSDGYAIFYPTDAQWIEIKSQSALGDQPGVAVLMSVGGWTGGNTNNQYVAVYAINKKLDLGKEHKKYRLVAFEKVGGKGDRLFTGLKESHQNLVLSGFSYGENDGLCCPSLPITLVLTISDRGNLEEVSYSQK